MFRLECEEMISINKQTDDMTYRGMTFTRDEIKRMVDAYHNFDELINKIVDDDAENDGLMENYAGPIPD